MQLFLVFVVLVFSLALFLYASPIILYVMPVAVIGVAISFLIGVVRHHSKTVKH